MYILLYTNYVYNYYIITNTYYYKMKIVKKLAKNYTCLSKALFASSSSSN